METIDYSKRITTRVKEMPLFSPVLSRIIDILNNEDFHLKDVVQVMETDASLTSRVLRVANSAAFPAINPVDNIARAIPRLGMHLLLSIAVESSTSHIYDKPLSGYESAKCDLWSHSLRTAIAAREIALRVKIDISPGLAYTAGLLHDMGKVIISEFLEGKTSQMVKWCDNSIVDDYIDAEREIIDTNHAKVGYSLAKCWNFPKSLQDAIAFHHHPESCCRENRVLTYLVHLGDIVAMLGGSGTGADTLVYKIQPGYKDYFHISKNDLASILINVLTEFDRTRSLSFGVNV